MKVPEPRTETWWMFSKREKSIRGISKNLVEMH